jgi:hypothetical protein
VPKGILYTVYALMALIGLVAMYTLLNAGSPNSLLRPLLPNPVHDFYLAAASSFLVFVLGFVVFYNRDREGFGRLLQLNADQIRSMRAQGHSDEQIADSILAAMGSASGYRHNLARKKLIVYLADFH